MEPIRQLIFNDESQLPVRVVLEETNDSGKLIRRVYVLRRTRRGGLLLNRDEMAQRQAA